MAFVLKYVSLIFILVVETFGYSIISQPDNNFTVLQGQGVILPFNYTLEPAESNQILTIAMTINASKVFTYSELLGDIIQNLTLGHFESRTDIKIIRSPQTYVGFVIQNTQWSDTGEYVWSLTVGGSSTVDGTPIQLIIGGRPQDATLQSYHKGGETYNLTCTVTGAIPLPDITILNGTKIIHTAISTESASVVINATVSSDYKCNGTNVFGSVISEGKTLPLTTTTIPTTTKSSSGTNIVSTTAKTTDKTTNEPKTEDGGSTDPTPDKTTTIVIAVAASCGGLIIIVVIVVVVCKQKGHKTHTENKGNALNERKVEHNSNPYELDEKVDSATRQEQEEKQQRNVEGLQYADLDLRPTARGNPDGGRTNLTFDDDSKTEYAEVRRA